MIKFEASIEKNDHTVVNCYTTSMDELMKFLHNYEEDYQWVIDNETGELLYRANHPTAEDHMDKHFYLMCLGWMVSASDPEEEFQKEIAKICEEFGVELN